MPSPKKGEQPKWAVTLALVSRSIGATLDDITKATGSNSPLSLIQDLRDRHNYKVVRNGARFRRVGRYEG